MDTDTNFCVRNPSLDCASCMEKPVLRPIPDQPWNQAAALIYILLGLKDEYLPGERGCWYTEGMAG